MLVLALALAAAAPPEVSGVTARAVTLVDELFLDPAKLAPEALLRAAAQELEDRVPWLLVAAGADGLALAHGAEPPFARVAWPATMDTLPRALGELVAAVAGAGHPVDGDLELVALSGMVEALDPHSRVLADERLDRFQVRLTGTFVGIGATFDRDGAGLVVTAVDAGGPAEIAGLRIGDRLVRVDGRSTRGMPVSEVVRRVRGAAGTAVRLEVERAGEALEVAPVRAEVVVANVTRRELDGGVGYVAIDHVSQRTVANLVEALAALRAEGAMSAGLVIDLRGNTGGSMKESAAAADLFVSSGELLRTVGRDGGPVANLQARMTARDTGSEVDVPVALVVDERTASGAEILAGALVELDRAVLVGRRTYGKGTVQKIYDLVPGAPPGEGVQLKLTVAKYLLAHDRALTAGGLVPDVTVVRAYDLGDHLACFGEAPPGVPDDAVVWQVSGGSDLPLEVARRAVIGASAPTREATLAALEEVAAEVRAAERAALASALGSRGLDWTSAPPGEAPWLSGDVELRASPVDEDTWRLEVAATNEGDVPLSRALVALSSETAPWWDGVRVPLGRIGPRQTARATVDVDVDDGVWPRLDAVEARLLADGRSPILFANRALPSGGSPRPTVRVEAALGPPTGQVGPGGGAVREVAVVLQNLDRGGLDGVELQLGFPGTDAVDLLDQGLHLGRLGGRSQVAGALQVEVRDGAPAELPLSLSLTATGLGTVLDWPLRLPRDGAPVALQAPRIPVPAVPRRVPAGVLPLPVEVRDDGALAAVTVALDGDKVLYAGGAAAELALAPRLSLLPGRHAVRISATDDQGITTARTLVVWAEEPEVAAGGE